MKRSHIALALVLVLAGPAVMAVLLVRHGDEPVFSNIPNEQVEHLGLRRAVGAPAPAVSREEAEAMAKRSDAGRDVRESLLVWHYPVNGEPVRLVWAVSLDVSGETEPAGPYGIPASNVYLIALIDATTGESLKISGLQKFVAGATPSIPNH